MKLHFDKYSAHGNDFIIVDNREHIIDRGNYKLFNMICRRRVSIGADGVILLDTDKKDFQAHFYNADGRPASMCGNGSRAVVDFAGKRGIIDREGAFYVQEKEHKFIIRDDGSVGVEILFESGKVTRHTFDYESAEYEGFFCNTGVNHLVIFDNALFENKPLDFAANLRRLPEFEPNGANVSFAKIMRDNYIEITTFEKGVEDFTLSCGTGAVAAALSAQSIRNLIFPVSVASKGGTLEITPGDSSGKMWINGKVSKIYSGTIDNAESFE